MITINPNRTDILIDALISLWEASVRATHHFLTKEDIQKLIPFVKMGLSNIETLIVVEDTHKPIAFMGIEESKIEMLFVLPDCFGKGIGKELITLAATQYGVQYVDVNEQNPQAIGFYSHIGFEVFERKETDEQGNPFPVLKMKRCLFSIRQATPNDITEIKELYKNTILTINRRDYSQEEVEDWASCGDDLSKIGEMIKTHYFIVAINQQLQIVGFSSITPQGYLHSMFVHKDFQGKGIATLLLKEIERYAITKGIMRITSEVSITARPFFEKWGYTVDIEQKRRANQLCLTNFWMAKELKIIKPYYGRIPACGVFCGGCPIYTRDKKTCLGADVNKVRCGKCKTFHLCCVEKGITHCHQCEVFPCAKFKSFVKRWLKYGQDFVENQKLLKQVGEIEFLKRYNQQTF